MNTATERAPRADQGLETKDQRPQSPVPSAAVAYTNPWDTPVSLADFAAFQARRAACLRSKETLFAVMDLRKALAAARKAHRAASRAHERAMAKWRATPSGQLEANAEERFCVEFAARNTAKPAA